VIGLVAIVSGAFGTTGPGRIGVAGLLSATLLFALSTSRVSTRVQRIAMGIVGLVFVAVSIALALGSPRFASGLVGIVDAFLTFVALVAILRRLATHPVITRRTLAGAACAYLLIGLFSERVHVPRRRSNDPVLCRNGSRTLRRSSVLQLRHAHHGGLRGPHADRGSRSDDAIVEALIGQLYLVTIVALVVANLGERRR
jgi:hypothetical protein